jgi:hypothetical protein
MTHSAAEITLKRASNKIPICRMKGSLVGTLSLYEQDDDSNCNATRSMSILKDSTQKRYSQKGSKRTSLLVKQPLTALISGLMIALNRLVILTEVLSW